MKTPDFEGIHGRMWKVPMKTLLECGPNTTLGCWILTVPGAHPLWHSYLLSIIHLRDVPGFPPAKKKYPEAEYEVILFALDPDEDLPDPDDVKNFHPVILTPPNLVEQIHGITDEQVVSIAEKLCRAFIDGIASPDTDFLSHTQNLLKNTVEHFTVGHHH